eukprot:m.164687 g.164687  ORF g.164687 m.164687 type:complete len:937 (+) comp14407_c0_seq2:573-3383(+)
MCTIVSFSVAGFSTSTMTIKTDTDDTNANCLTRISHWIDAQLNYMYYRLGKLVARRPLVFIIVPAIIMIGFGMAFVLDVPTPEEDPEDLYTPQDSVSFAERIVIEEQFGFEPAFNSLIMNKADSDFVLDISRNNDFNKKSLLDLMTAYEILQNVTTTNNATGETVTYESRCNITGVCLEFSVLDFFNYNRTIIENDNDVMQTINNKLTTNMNPTLAKASIFGGMTPENSTTPTIAFVEALYLRFIFTNLEERVNNTRVFDEARAEWELEAATVLRESEDFVATQALPFFGGDFSDAATSAISGDTSLIPIGYIFLVVYAVWALSTRNYVYSYGSMAALSVVAIGFAIVGMLGLGQIFGIEYSFVVQAAFFLLMGLGVDDTFVILGSHSHLSHIKDVEERMGQTLASSGVSITITSITSTFAFAAGVITSLPAIRIFCLYSLMGILCTFILQITFVLGCLVLTTRREQAKRADWLCCIKPSEPEAKCCSSEKFDENAPDILDQIFGIWMPKYILHPAGKFVVLLIAVVLTATAAYYATQVPTDFNIVLFIPKEHPILNSYAALLDYSGGETLTLDLVTGASELGYGANETQDALTDVVTDLVDNEFILYCANNWWLAFLGWAQTNKAAELVGGYIPDAKFYPFLTEFLAEPANTGYARQIVLEAGEIALARIECEAADFRAREVELVDSVRAVVANYTILGGSNVTTDRGDAVTPFMYNENFLFFDGYAVIKTETLRNVLIAAVAVLVITLLLLANVGSALILLCMLALVDVNVLGFMYYVDLDFNSVTAVNLVVAVGLAIDASVHIAHAFLASHGTRDERAKKALRKLGKSVFSGTFSTFIPLAVLGAAQSYIFTVFFKLLSIILFFAFFFGAMVLPVVLSMIGPAPYPVPEFMSSSSSSDLKAKQAGEDWKAAPSDEVVDLPEEQTDEVIQLQPV